MPFCIITNKTLCCDFSNRKYENRQAHFAPRETGTWVTASLGKVTKPCFWKKEGTNWRKKGGKHGELHAVIFVRRCVWFSEKLAISLKQYIVWSEDHVLATGVKLGLSLWMQELVVHPSSFFVASGFDPNHNAWFDETFLYIPKSYFFSAFFANNIVFQMSVDL